MPKLPDPVYVVYVNAAPHGSFSQEAVALSKGAKWSNQQRHVTVAKEFDKQRPRVIATWIDGKRVY